MITVLREELGDLPPSDRRLILVLAENPLARVSWIAAAAYADGSSKQRARTPFGSPSGRLARHRVALNRPILRRVGSCLTRF